MIHASLALMCLRSTTEICFASAGDLAPLVELARLRRQYGFLLIIDEAHATLMLGQRQASQKSRLVCVVVIAI